MYDLAGKTFGFLKVLRRAPGRPEHHKQVAWVCRCVCGAKHESTSRELRSGHTKSCGCQKSSLCRGAHTQHGHAARRTMGLEYRVWIEMKQRCYNPKANRYYTHGARGIRVCKRWLHSFENFLADMGPKPRGLSLERRNNSGHYEPGNCYWATRKQQGRNKRNNRMLTAHGKSLCASEWAELTGVPSSTIRARLKRGWSAEEAICLRAT